MLTNEASLESQYLLPASGGPDALRGRS
jgi:hypothetical protein